MLGGPETRRPSGGDRLPAHRTRHRPRPVKLEVELRCLADYDTFLGLDIPDNLDAPDSFNDGEVA
jgi:hypothetical protein